MKRRITTGDYISSGLVFHLNAEDYKGQGWTDRINGIEVTANNVTLQGVGLSFDGTKSYCTVDNSIAQKLTSSNATLEMLFSHDNDFNSFEVLLSDLITPVKMGASFLKRNNTICAYSSENSKKETFQYENKSYDTSLMTVTYDNSHLKVYLNGDTLTNASEDNFIGMSEKEMIIGARYNGSYNSFFKGKIYNTRIYDRVLEQEEIKHNYNIDILKYKK